MSHTVHITEIINHPIKKVWKIISPFNGLPAYHPAILASKIEGDGNPEKIGNIRHLTLESGFVREELLMLDNDTFAFDYSIIESSLPIENYNASVRLTSNSTNDQTICEWWADFDVVNANRDEILELVGQHVFKAGFLALAAKLEKANSIAYH
jgi:hypothetical protein